MMIGQDHPRGCGEHTAPSDAIGCVSGSSPRMRGALFIKTQMIHYEGIIPADAGSTVTMNHPPPKHKDHPRGCGEHTS